MNKKSKKIKINNIDYSINKLPLGKYAELLERLDTLPEEISEIFLEIDIDVENKNNSQWVRVLPKLLAKAFPQTIEIISFSSGIPQKVLIDECGLAEVIEILETVWETNDFDIVKNKLASVFQKVAKNKQDEKVAEETAEAKKQVGSTK